MSVTAFADTTTPIQAGGRCSQSKQTMTRMMNTIYQWLCLLVILIWCMNTEAVTTNRKWRMCYVCSGMYPDRECELYPRQITMGPGKLNCTRQYCTTYVRYKPDRSVLKYNAEGRVEGTIRKITPWDFEVHSIARDCENFGRGNGCELDGDGMGITCYSTCSEHYCNDITRTPTWDLFEPPSDDDQSNQMNSTTEPSIVELPTTIVNTEDNITIVWYPRNEISIDSDDQQFSNHSTLYTSNFTTTSRLGIVDARLSNNLGEHTTSSRLMIIVGIGLLYLKMN